jgi:signal transduction histidine kinase
MPTKRADLSALVNNLLDMARLQSGAVNLRSDWQSVEEVVGSAIRAGAACAGNGSGGDGAAGRPAAGEFDAVLMERVLVNLLENAAKYGKPPIEIAAAGDGHGAAAHGARPRARPAGCAQGPRAAICSRNSRAARRIGHAGRGPGPGDLPGHGRGAPRAASTAANAAGRWCRIHHHPAAARAAPGWKTPRN